MPSKPQQQQVTASPAAPAWAVKLIAEMQARKVAAPVPVFSAGLRAAAARVHNRRRGCAYGTSAKASYYTAAW